VGIESQVPLDDPSGSLDARQEAAGDWNAAASLARLIDHLLGGGPKVMADAGLARFSERRLALIQCGAEQQAEECLHGLQSLSFVLGVALSHPQDTIPRSVLCDVVWHFHGQASVMERLAELADNAATLRKSPQVAADLARRYVDWARSVGEWPDRGATS
jgi:hypothetical protein